MKRGLIVVLVRVGASVRVGVRVRVSVRVSKNKFDVEALRIDIAR